MNKLEQLERDIVRYHQWRMIKLETKYKSLIDDLIDEKIVIQQKLQQCFWMQINQIHQLKSAMRMQHEHCNNTFANDHDNKTITSNTNNQNVNIRYQDRNHGIHNNTEIKEKHSLAPNKSQALKSEQPIATSILTQQQNIITYDINNNNNLNKNKNNTTTSNINIDDHATNTNKTKVVIDESKQLQQMQARMREKISKHIKTTKTENNLNEKQSNIVGNLNTMAKTKQKQKQKKKKNKNKNNGTMFVCRDCDKIFTQRSCAEDHVARIHMDEKPFKCKECDQCFALWGPLNRHKNIHTTRFQCKRCGKKFSNGGHLNVHEKIHQRQILQLKKYNCDQCDKLFDSKLALAQHKIVHDSQNPYQCEKCHKKFYQLSGLKKHKELMHM